MRWANDSVSISPNSNDMYIRQRYYDSGWINYDAGFYSTDGWVQIGDHAESDAVIGADATAYGLMLNFVSTAIKGSWFLVDQIRLVSTGTNNEHDQQYVDNGTGTQESANSWNGAFIS
jgi:hypothetical protein